MKIYIITAVILFCNNALAMENPTKTTIIPQHDPFPIIIEASGYRQTIDKPGSVAIVTQNVVHTYNITQPRNRLSNLRKLLICHYLTYKQNHKDNPFPSKL